MSARNLRWINQNGEVCRHYMVKLITQNGADQLSNKLLGTFVN